MRKNKCFADVGTKCKILKAKKCISCSFYKTHEQHKAETVQYIDGEINYRMVNEKAFTYADGQKLKARCV